jgi:hypothetical protein
MEEVVDMRRVKLLCLSLLVVFVFGVVTAAAASAVALPEYTVAAPAKSAIGKITYEATGLQLSCAKGTEQFSPSSGTPKKSGPFTVDFEECKATGQECHSLGSAAGTLLAGGEWRLVRGKSEEALIWYIPSHEIHIECKAAATLLLLAGSVLGVITPLLIKTFSCENTLLISAGVQAVTEYENDSGTKVKVSSTVSINGGTARAVAVSAGTYKIESEKETEIIDTK